MPATDSVVHWTRSVRVQGVAYGKYLGACAPASWHLSASDPRLVDCPTCRRLANDAAGDAAAVSAWPTLGEVVVLAGVAGILALASVAGALGW